MGVPPEESNPDRKMDHPVKLKVLNTLTYPTPPTRIDFNLQPGKKVKELKEDIQRQHGYPIAAIDLTLGKKILQDEELLDTYTDKLLMLQRSENAKDTDFPTQKSLAAITTATTTTTTTTSSSNPPSSSPKPNSIHTPKSSTGTDSDGRATSNALVVYGSGSTGGAGSTSSYNYYQSDWTKKSSTGFVGLSNQGATCYMNSLIQSLFMTPEFRIALYKWNFHETYARRERERQNQASDKPPQETSIINPEEKKKQAEKDSIPRQLQLLFTRLQLSDQRATKTKELTNSFGWKESDAFTQHDVQELCRVLFDALEKVLKGTEQENLINDLYQGEMKDYVKCKECNNESSRTDKYLDIPLVIRGFGSTTPVKSVEEALQRFITPEVLEGSNQYQCAKCNKKVDAMKGLKFASFPYLLTLQLKRFDFDYETMRRIKLNDRVTFPPILDLNPYVDTIYPINPDHMEVEQTELNSIPEKGVKDKMEEDPRTPANNEWENVEELAKKYLERGPYVYELYSVLVHRGSALGGHYYAYIKSFEKDKWFEFNDSSVSEIDVNDIMKTYGEEEKRTGMMQWYASSANAYMLLYRRIDSTRNKKSVLDEEIPEELVQVMNEETTKAKRKAEEKEQEKDTLRLKVFYNNSERVVKIHNKTTLAVATKMCAEAFNLLEKFPLDCIRLRNYQSYSEIPAEPFGSPDQMDKSLETLHFYSQKSIMIETKSPNEEFPEYNPSHMIIRVIRYDSNTKSFADPVMLSIDKDATLGDLRKVIAQRFDIPADKQRIIREAFASAMIGGKAIIGDDGVLRIDHRVFEASKIYVEYCEDENEESPAIAEIERIRNMIELKYNLIGSEEADQTIKANKKMLYRELKVLLAEKVGISPDEFRVSKGNISWKVELRNEDETLDGCNLMDGMRLFIEKGKPMREGETRINFWLFDPEQKRTKDYFEEAFDLPVPEEGTLPEVKKIIADKLLEVKKVPEAIDPGFIRIREMWSKSPGKVYMDSKTLKESAYSLYPGKSLAIEILEDRENVKTDDDLPIFIQHWSPSKFEVGPKIRITVQEQTPITEFKEHLSQRFNIKNVGIAKAAGNWPGTDLLEIPQLSWDKEVPQYAVATKAGLMGSAPLYLHAGDIIYFRDNDEPLKELSKEEKKKLEKEVQSKKVTRYTYHTKEEALHINAKDL